MKPPKQVRALRRCVAAAVVAAAVTGTAMTGLAQPGTPRDAAASPRSEPATAVYIVQMDASPAAVVEQTAGQLDTATVEQDRYVDQLETAQRQVAAMVGATPIHQYHHVFNGFAATLDPVDVSRLRSTPGVRAVTRSEIRQLDTASTPEYLGLTGPGGLWESAGGLGTNGAGEGVVIGIIDSGITPDSPSFSDPDPGGQAFPAPPAGWSGTCDVIACSNKLIGARYFNDGFGGDDAVNDIGYELISPVDVDGHGTHVAATAAGNSGTPSVIAGFDFGGMSGMAPRAHLAVYKVCWGRGNDGGCATADAVAAIDQAVADGVDVINYSISGPKNSSIDPVEEAFRAAAAAGVFIAASAGNNGDDPGGGAGSVAHNSPWITTVAASTQPRVTAATLSLGNGATFQGASLATAAVGPADLVASVNVAGLGADADDARLCRLGSLDPALVAGKIVLCERGENARVDKSEAVLEAGGVGMVLVNVTPGTVNADSHSVPTVHLSHQHYATLTAYANTAAPTASIGVATASNQLAGFVPTMASFSSFGPSGAHGGDVIKPDITAPGVDIISAFTPLNGGASVGVESGTSMSSPHIAGVAALLVDLHPSWSPMMIKSALLTTADPFAGGSPVHGAIDAFDYGSGHVVPISAADPGLVYDSTPTEWLGFLCAGVIAEQTCALGGVPVLDPSDLNSASIAIGSLVNRQTVVRRVTNVGAAATYTGTAVAPPGVDVEVAPASLTLAPGETGTFTVTFTVDNDQATFGQYRFGSLTWSGGGHSVRSQIAVRPLQVGTPVSAVAPTFIDLCGIANDIVSVPAVVGLTYVINGVPVSQGSVASSGATNVQATPNDGYHVVGTDDFFFQFTDVACVPAVVPTPPARFLDTRDEPTFDSTFRNVGRLGGGGIARVKIAGRGAVPPDAVGAVVNLTVVDPTAVGHATIYPCTSSVPLASNLNYKAGDVVANNTVVALSDEGDVCVSTLSGADFALDVTGYVPNNSSFVAFSPRRYLDTRPTAAFPTFDAAASGRGRLVAGGTIEVAIAGRGAVPADARSAVINVTAINPDAAGYITVYPCGQQPNASTINYLADQVAPNGVVADLSDTGSICLYSSATVDLALDVGGWAPATDSLRTMTPARFLDTRDDPQFPTFDSGGKGGGPIEGGRVVEVLIAGRGIVPADATAALLNLAVVYPGGPGYLTVFPCGQTPTTSAVNHSLPGTVRANNAVAKLSPSGTVCVFTLATTDIIIDVAGWVP